MSARKLVGCSLPLLFKRDAPLRLCPVGEEGALWEGWASKSRASIRDFLDGDSSVSDPKAVSSTDVVDLLSSPWSLSLSKSLSNAEQEGTKCSLTLT